MTRNRSVVTLCYRRFTFAGVVFLEEARMRHIDFDARVLGMKLGLGDLAPRSVCMGYQHACVCDGCMLRENGQRKRPARQPWTPVRRAA